jgi:hypothetical protein
MKEEIRSILADGSERTVRELNALIEPESVQKLHEALAYMRKSGEIQNGTDRPPGDPGGLSGKGARPIKTWRMTVEEDEPADIRRPEPAILQGKSGDIVAIMRGQALREAYPEVIETFDKLDDAADSHNGDEFEMPLSGHGELQTEWDPDVARSLADMRCSRCDPALSEDRAALLLHGAEELLIGIARERLRGDPVWDLAHAHYQALMEVL